ncbi:hypothetical protein A3A21_02155 [Candidatus Jorgensenbacteria bacterium RIFCSPLOWO2_01_FULL_45_25b]|uniref:Probable membrane transporter protein n=1 Tax=Candidatus Jorgensenbacteria bacterium RIFCSPLOWO2_01_FULL_45_25b TaxID=1798471 RepID=A0A1F6BYY4_9BACT|nr:MAG: hypothetical protein A3A21_02155 [Candidatus Jorgensenbacteria bacterium RIFCSPLOWO2_01_FULL_45_25b]
MTDILLMSLVGLIGGFVGSQAGAGSLITLPALLFLGLPPALAVGTNILSAWLTNVVAALTYWRKGKLRNQETFSLGIIAFFGSLGGAYLILYIPEDLTRKIIGILFLLLIGVLVWENGKKGEKEKKKPKHALGVAHIISFVLGVYGGFLSVAVTTLFILMFVLLLRRSFVEGVAEAVTVSAILLFGALVVFVKEGSINMALALPLAIGSVIGAYGGAKTAMKLGEKWIKPLVGIVMIGAATKLLLNF